MDMRQLKCCLIVMAAYVVLSLSNFNYFCPHMRVAIILICLCYLLLGGYNYVYTGSHHNNYSPVLHIKKNHQAKFTSKNQRYSVVKEASPGQDEASFIANDMEDEDSNNLFARKYKLLASHFYILSYAADLTHLYSRCTTQRPGHSILSNKYITQRALRI
jgi:hypothetical protein